MKKLQVLFVALLLLLPLGFVPRASAQTPPFVGRIAGADRIGTAIALSQAAWPSPPVDAVLVARSDAFPDALAAGPLARQLNAPILLTDSTELLPVVANEIRRLLPERIYLLGGEAALSLGVENALKALAPDVERLSGASRYATAEAIADRTDGNVAAVASGENFPDALSANSLAPSDILLTQRNVLSFDARRLGPTTIVGGTAVIAPNLLVAPRLAGSNRYLTNLVILREVMARRSGQFQLFVATGENFPDALAAGSLTQPILLVNPAWTELPAELEAFLTENRARFNAVFIFGGTSAVPEATERLVAAALGVPAPGPDPDPDPGPDPQPGPGTPPATPSLLTAEAASTQIDLAWTDNSDDETSFQIQRSLGTAETFTALASTEADVTAYTDDDLDPETEYCYRARAVNNAGASAYTAMRCATTPAPPAAPAAPGSLVVTPTSSTQINLAWSDNSDDEDSFQIQRTVGAEGTFANLATTGANATTFTDDELDAETEYCYRLRAVNAAGPSAYTTAQCATTAAPPNPPAAPDQLEVIATGPTRISINWDDNADNETAFDVERAITEAGSFSLDTQTSANDTNTNDTRLEPSTEYCYRIRAINADTGSAYTPWYVRPHRRPRPSLRSRARWGPRRRRPAASTLSGATTASPSWGSRSSASSALLARLSASPRTAPGMTTSPTPTSKLTPSTATRSAPRTKQASPATATRPAPPPDPERRTPRPHRRRSPSRLRPPPR